MLPTKTFTRRNFFGLLAFCSLLLGMWYVDTLRVKSPESFVVDAPVDILLTSAEAYAIAHTAELKADDVVTENGVTLSVGTEPGQSLSPTPGQLSALGYARAMGPEGVVRIAKLPANCKPKNCKLTVVAMSQGEQKASKLDAFKN